MQRLLIGVFLACSACSQPTGPALAPDVCWAVSTSGDGPNFYEAIDDGVANLETCAARLEAVRMMERRSVTGFYNGQFIFVTDEQISSAQTLDGTRFRVFEPGDREQIQRDIQTLMEGETARKGDGG